MHAYTRLSFLLTLLFALAACSDSSGPDVRKEFSQYFNEHSQHWEAREFKLIVSENVGTEAQPVYHARFEANVAPVEPLYLLRASILDTDVLEQVQKKGQKFNLHVLGEFVFYGGNWESVFHIESGYPEEEGRPASSYNQRHVVKGTSAYRDLLKQAQANVNALEQAIAADEVAVRQARESLEQLQRSLEEELNISTANLAELGRHTQEQRRLLSEKLREEQQSGSTQRRTELSEQESTLQNEHRASIERIEAAYRTQIEALSNERTMAKQQRTELLNQASAGRDADIQAARSSMDPNVFRAFRTEANARLQSERQTIESGYRDRLAAIGVREAAARKQRQEDTQAANQRHNEQVATLRDQANQANRASQDESRRQYQGDVAKIDSRFHDAQQAHRMLQSRANEQINMARAALRNQQQALDQIRRELEQVSQQVAVLNQ